MRPSTRSLYEYRFANVSAELLEKLLEYAVPLDEKAMKQMDDAANELALANKKLEQEKLDELMQRLPVIQNFWAKHYEPGGDCTKHEGLRGI